MILHDSKDQFYAELDQRIKEKEITSEEIITFIECNRGENIKDNTSQFYELCSKFSDVALNAPKAADPKTCDVQASFQFTDINKAKEAFQTYIDEHGLSDIEGVLDAVRIMHRLAVAWDDPRSKCGLIRPKGYDWTPGFAGKYHNFCELPDDIWKTIRAEIIKEMKD